MSLGGALYYAIQHQKTESLKAILQHPDANLNGTTSQRPILMAAQIGDMDAFSALYHDKRCDVTAMDENGNDILMIAATHGQTTIAKTVLQGIQTKNMRKNRQGDDALSRAITFGHPDMVDLLLADGRCDTHLAIFSAIKSRNTVMLDTILKNTNPKDLAEHLNNPLPTNDGNAAVHPLYYATSFGNPDVFRQLFEHPLTKVEMAKNSDGLTPLILACEESDEGYYQIIRIILDDPRQIIDPNTPSMGYTALGQCIRHQNTEAARILLAHERVDPNMVATEMAIPRYDNLRRLKKYASDSLLLKHALSSPNTTSCAIAAMIIDHPKMNPATETKYQPMVNEWRTRRSAANNTMAHPAR